MWKSIHENLKEFWIGTGCFGGGTFLFIKEGFLVNALLSLGTVALTAIIGGMFTALAADVYKHHIQKKIFKKKDNGKSDREKAA